MLNRDRISYLLSAATIILFLVAFISVSRAETGSHPHNVQSDAATIVAATNDAPLWLRFEPSLDQDRSCTPYAIHLWPDREPASAGPVLPDLSRVVYHTYSLLPC